MKIDDTLRYLVLSIVEEIPYGKVATYGDIAKLAGYPNYSRHVGRILAESTHYGDYPCHRVVNAHGRLAPHFDDQRVLLSEEGVTFTEKHCVNMKEHRWSY